MGYSGRLLVASSSLFVLSALTVDAAAQPAQPQPAPAPAPSSSGSADIGVAPPPAQPAPQPTGQVVVVQPPTPPPAAAPKKPKAPEKEWYGWQTLIADAAAVGLYAGGLSAHTPSIYDVGIGTYLLAPPIIHIVHGNVGPAFGSLGMRLIVPPIAGGFGFVIGLIVAGNRNADVGSWVGGGVVGFGVGMLVGIGACMAIDAFLLGYEKVSPDDNLEYGKATPKPRPSFTLVPTFAPTAEGGAMGGLGGTF